MPQIRLEYLFESEEELRAHLTVETRAVEAPAAPAVEAPAAPAVEAPAAPAVEAPVRSASDVDADGMPYDDAIHADPPTTTADGLWRAKRGKADEAKTARAAFKASGGDVEPPAAAPAEASFAMPGTTPLPADAPEPISLDRVIEKINGMLTRQSVDQAALAPMYAEHSGTSAEASFGVFQTNETARANLFAALCDIEPEMR